MQNMKASAAQRGFQSGRRTSRQVMGCPHTPDPREGLEMDWCTPFGLLTPSQTTSARGDP